MPAATLSLLVRTIRREASGVHSYELVDPLGADLPAVSAGSHVDVHVNGSTIRQYSLASDPANRKHYVIAVLREEAGRGGSRAMHESVHVGDRVQISAPRNAFALASDAQHHILIAGGIGITPLKAMAHALAADDASFELHYCAKTADHAAFREELSLHGKRVTHHFDNGNPTDGLDLAALLAAPAVGTHVYYCGPSGFMAACAAATAHWPAGSVHSEHFKVPTADADARPVLAPGSFTVQIASSGLEFVVPADRSVVDMMNENGVETDTSCISGLCGTCKTGYVAGEIDHQDYILSEDERAAFFTPCVSRATSAVLVLDR